MEYMVGNKMKITIFHVESDEKLLFFTFVFNYGF